MPLCWVTLQSLAILAGGATAVASDVDFATASAAMESDDECQAGDAGCSVNALQLQRAKIGNSTSEDDATTNDAIIAGDENDCKPCAQICSDYMTYGVHEECEKDTQCKVLNGPSDVNKTWFCACSDEKCKAHADVEDFQPLDEVPEEYAPENQSDVMDTLSSGSRWHSHHSSGSCIYHGAKRCNRYWHGNYCQCTSSCHHHHNCCHDYDAVCHSPPAHHTIGNPMTLYHTTSPHIANMIVASNFRPGHAGWCGGAIYFINHPILPKTKYGWKTKSGAIIQATVNMGKVCHMSSHCHGGGGTGVSAAKRMGCNSIIFNPGDGAEFIIWDASQVVFKKRYQ